MNKRVYLAKVGDQYYCSGGYCEYTKIELGPVEKAIVWRSQKDVDIFMALSMDQPIDYTVECYELKPVENKETEQ